MRRIDSCPRAGGDLFLNGRPCRNIQDLERYKILLHLSLIYVKFPVFLERFAKTSSYDSMSILELFVQSNGSNTMNRLIFDAAVRVLAIAVGVSGAANVAHAGEDTLAGSNCSASNFVEGDPGACIFGVSNSVTNGATLRLNSVVSGEATRRDVDEESKLSLRRGFDGITGVTAGDSYAGFGVWASYARANFAGDLVFARAKLAYDGESDSINFGVDRLVGERFLIGLAVGYENTASTTTFNGGETDTDGFSVVPYAAWLINDVFSVDFAGGYGSLDTDQNRISTIDGSQIDASYDSKRLFFTANLNATAVRGNWVFGGQLGVLRSNEEQNAFTETGNAASAARLWMVRERDVSITQFVAGLDVGYALGGSGFEPYGRVAYRNDLSRDNGVESGGLMPMFTQVQADDDDEWEVGGGIRYFGNDVSGGLELFTTRGREAFENWSVLANVRVEL